MTAIEPIGDEALALCEEVTDEAHSGILLTADIHAMGLTVGTLRAVFSRLRRAEAERDEMRNDEAFIRDIFKESFETADLDGGWLQDEGEKRGYLTRVEYDPAKHGEIDVDNGDKIYVLCDRLKSARALADTKGA